MTSEALACWPNYQGRAETLAECSSLAATTPLPQMRDQYHRKNANEDFTTGRSVPRSSRRLQNI